VPNGLELLENSGLSCLTAGASSGAPKASTVLKLPYFDEPAPLTRPFQRVQMDSLPADPMVVSRLLASLRHRSVLIEAMRPAVNSS
jgi:hypothetical protein